MAANLDNGVILGALGSVFTGTAAEIKPPPGMVIAAIQFITPFAPTEMVAEDPNKTFNTELASHQATTSGNPTVGYDALGQDHGTGGQTFTGDVPVGMTLYGRWVSFKGLSSNRAILYFGY